MPDGADNDLLAAHTIQDDIWGSPDNQLTDFGMGTGAAQIRMISQRFDDRYNPCGQTIRSFRFVHSDVSANLSETRSCQRRPDNL